MTGPEPHPRPRPLRILLLLLATGTLLGLWTNMAKVAANAGLAASAYLVWSCLGAGAGLALLAGARGTGPRWSATLLRYAVAAAALSLAVPNLLFFSAVPHVGASFVALCIAFPPLFTYLGAIALRLEPPDAWRLLGVMLALAGAAYIALLKLTVPEAPMLWIAAALIGPAVLAAGNLYRTFAWPASVRPDQLAPGLLLAAGALVAFASLILDLPLMPATAVHITLIAAQAIIFAGPFSLLFQLPQHGGPVYLSLLGAVGAVTGVPFALSVLNESPPDGLPVGAAFIATGVAFLTYRSASTLK